MSSAAGVLAVVVVRLGHVPAGADETVAEAGGDVLLVGSGTADAVPHLASARQVRCAETGASQLGLAATVASVAARYRLVVMPASADGRDLAPRVAAVMERPLLAGAVAVGLDGDRVRAELLRLDGRVTVPASTVSPAVATLWPGARAPEPAGEEPDVVHLDAAGFPHPGGGPDVERRGLVPPDPSTMDLSEATRVLGGGAGLVPSGASDAEARAWFELLSAVAAALGASAGGTRVVTDAGWLHYDRQIGTTGVSVSPHLYVAFGISGASQHVGGLGSPTHTVSVNLDAHCPMTAMSDLGVVSDAGAVLIELAGRLGVRVPDQLGARSEA